MKAKVNVEVNIDINGKYCHFKCRYQCGLINGDNPFAAYAAKW